MSLAFTMDGDKIDWRKRVVLGKLARGKEAARRPKVLFLSYFAKEPLIQLTQLSPLRALLKSEDCNGVVVENTSLWLMYGSMMGWHW